MTEVAVIAKGLQRVPIDSVTPHPRNARQGDIGAISESLRRFGQTKPIVVQASTDRIIAGNHLWHAARQLGWKEVAVVRVDMDDDKALAYLIADNRTQELGSYDESALADILAELAAAGNLEATGYDGDDVDDLLRLVAAPPDLGALADKHGVPEHEAFWPRINARVDPETFARWESAWKGLTGSDSDRIGTILDRYEASL